VSSSDSHLDGLVVVEDARLVAAPFCGQLLRWLGATVLKVAPSPDEQGGFEDGAFAGLVEDFVDEGKQELGRDALLSTLATADVFVCDRTAAELDRLGLDPERLRGANTRLVFVSVTGYGLSGPHAERPASELTAYQAGGEGYMLPPEPVYSLFPDRPPVRGGRSLADYDAGLCAALGAVAALDQRERTGEGELVEISAQEVELGLNRTTLSRCFHEGFDVDRAYRGYDYAGTLLCADGYVCIRPVEDRQWASFARAIGRRELADDPRFATRAARFEHGVELTEELERWTRSRTRADAKEAMLASGCPGGPFLEPSEVLDDSTLAVRGVFQSTEHGRAPHRLFVGSTSPIAPGETPAGGHGDRVVSCGRPLAGIRVIDLTWVAAGPYAAELLAFMGADVIKVESPDRPDLFRRRQDGGADPDSSIRFVDINQGKRSIKLDLKDDEGRRTIMRLAGNSALLLENFRPGVRERLGLSDEALRAVNPALVTVAISGFGHDGPESTRPGYASVFNAESGIGALTGYPDAPPADVRDSHDLRIGMVACLAAVTGLLGASRRSVATSYSIAGREALIALQGDVFLEASRGGAPTRSGNALGRLCPYGCFRAPAGAWVAVTVRTLAEWRALVGVVDADVLRSEDLEDLDARWERRLEAEQALEGWLAQRPASESVALLGRAGVPAALSSSATELLHDPHLRERGFFRISAYGALGELTFLGAPVRFGRIASPVPEVGPPPRLGEHTADIMRALAGDARLVARARVS
jgi:crotonobetainyl-CoA:carnitine CoA-transferase CaiB-like acyl-CoA transferase